MGCFGYICKGCGTPINGDTLSGGEKCVIIHVRHGEVIGRVEGHYDEYGRVVEQEGFSEIDRYRGDHEGPNGHSAICDSEFYLEDSYFRLQGLRVYNSQEVSLIQYTIAKMRENNSSASTESNGSTIEPDCSIEREFVALPVPARDRYSGSVVWHSRCYQLASPEAQADLTPSRSDPDQSWGRVRKKYK